jgi:hypothetical protein
MAWQIATGNSSFRIVELIGYKSTTVLVLIPPSRNNVINMTRKKDDS